MDVCNLNSMMSFLICIKINNSGLIDHPAEISLLESWKIEGLIDLIM